jgi:hypothetical protein
LPTSGIELCVHHAEGIFQAERHFGTTITNSNGKAVPVRYIGEQHVLEDCGGQKRVLEQTDLDTALEAVTHDYLGEAGVDWYNDDGGYGTLTINVEEGAVALEISVRHSNSSREYSAKRSIATGEEMDF